MRKFLSAVLITLFSTVSNAATLAVAVNPENSDIYTVLDEKCDLKEVKLGNKATVRHKDGKVDPSCAGNIVELGIVVFYNSVSKDLVFIPISLFKPAKNV